MSRETNSESTADELADMHACRELASAGEAAPSPLGLVQLKREVDANIATERGLLATLRTQSTPRRALLVALAGGATTALAHALHPRSDWGDYPRDRMAVTLALLGALAALAVWRLLRPLHLPPPPRWSSVVLVAAGLLVPFLCAVVPVEGGTHETGGEGALFAVHCFRCLGVGALAGIPVLLLAAAARRAQLDGPAIAGLAGVGAGLIGNFALQLVCATVEVDHLLLGHVSLLVVLGSAAWLWRSRGEAVQQAPERK